MKNLTDAGIIDLGGVGTLLLEIEYNNDKGEFQEAVFRLPKPCNKQDIVNAYVFQMGGLHLYSGKEVFSVILLHFQPKPEDQVSEEYDAFTIYLPDICVELVEVRLLGADEENITDMFLEKS